MAGRKKLFKNYLLEHLKETTIEKDGLQAYSFVNLKQEEVPTQQNIGALIYHAYDVHREDFAPYKIIGYTIKDDKILFEVCDYYIHNKEGENVESLGARRTFYQEDIVLIPKDLISKKHRIVS